MAAPGAKPSAAPRAAESHTGAQFPAAVARASGSTTAPAPPHLYLLDQAEAAARQSAHEARVDAFTAPFLRRRHRGEKHPVNDFLFTYYTLTPAALRRWHPGVGAVLTGRQASERAAWKFYRSLTQRERSQLGLGPDSADGPDTPDSPGIPAVTVDAAAFHEARDTAVGFVRELLSRSAARPARFGCFGMHEWAMAYKSDENQLRHEYLDLRLGAQGTDEVLRSHKISCTHFDAFRFYAPQARELNELQPTRATQRDLEQPGCLHANMDLYKWSYKLLPLVDSELLMDCFELAARIREMDMRASPYDLADWGYPPIAVETAEGKAEYVRAQRAFSAESATLRERLLAAL